MQLGVKGRNQALLGGCWSSEAEHLLPQAGQHPTPLSEMSKTGSSRDIAASLLWPGTPGSTVRRGGSCLHPLLQAATLSSA